jgi:hypothetical protein
MLFSDFGQRARVHTLGLGEILVFSNLRRMEIEITPFFVIFDSRHV